MKRVNQPKSPWQRPELGRRVSGTTVAVGTAEWAMSWHRADRLEAEARRLLAGFAELCPAGERAAGRLDVSVSGKWLPASYLGLGARPPTSGPMAGLPVVPGLTFDSWPGLSVWAWRDAGLLASIPGAGYADFHPAEGRAEDTSWMVAQLTGTVLYLLGAVRPLHATAVRWDGRTVLLMGGSGSGKTTLTLILAMCGARVLAEDFVYVAATGRVLNMSIRRRLTLRRGTWQALRPAAQRWWGQLPEWTGDIDPAAAFEEHRRGQVRLPLDPIEDRTQPPTGRVDAVLLPSIRPDLTGCRVRTSPPSDLARAIAFGVDQRMIEWPIPLLRRPNRPGTPAPPSHPARSGLPQPVPVVSVEFGIDYRERIGELQDTVRGAVRAVAG